MIGSWLSVLAGSPSHRALLSGGGGKRRHSFFRQLFIREKETCRAEGPLWVPVCMGPFRIKCLLQLSASRNPPLCYHGSSPSANWDKVFLALNSSTSSVRMGGGDRKKRGSNSAKGTLGTVPVDHLAGFPWYAFLGCSHVTGVAPTRTFNPKTARYTSTVKRPPGDLERLTLLRPWSRICKVSLMTPPQGTVVTHDETSEMTDTCGPIVTGG